MNIDTKDTSWERKIIAFLTSQTISLFGSSLVQFAIIWYIAKITNSGIMVTLSTICSFLPQVFISLLGGVWADRYSRKTLIILADATIALSTLILALLMLFGYQHMWMLMAVSAVRSLGTGVQTPAESALIPQIVPKDKLMKISGINGTIMSLVNFIAPAVGGAVLNYGRIEYVMLVDVFTAIIGITILLCIHIPLHEKAKAERKPGYFTDLKEGLHFAWHNFFISRLLGFYMVFTILIVPAAFLNVLMVRRIFSDSYWYLTLNEMTFFIGSAIGGMVMAYWGGFKNKLVTFCMGTAVFGLCTFSIGFINIFWVYLIIMVFTGFTLPAFNTPVMVLLQEKVPPDMQGRVFSLTSIIFSAFMPIGMAIFGPLADIVPIQWLMIGSGLLLICLSFAILGYKRFMHEGLPTIDDVKSAD